MEDAKKEEIKANANMFTTAVLKSGVRSVIALLAVIHFRGAFAINETRQALS